MRPKNRATSMIRRVFPGPVNYLRHLFYAYTLEKKARLQKHHDPDTPAEEGKISLVLTDAGDRASLEGFIQSLAEQRRMPDEVIFLSRGSGPSLPEIQRQMEGKVDTSIEVVDGGDLSCGAARNLGIQHAAHDLVVLSETDCVPDPDWLHEITLPLVRDEELAFSLGPVEVDTSRDAAQLAFRYPLGGEGVNLLSLLAFVKNVSFRKIYWARAGGFPEGAPPLLDVLIFSMRLEGQEVEYVKSPSARVTFVPHPFEGGLWSRFFTLSQGMGKVGLFAPVLWKHLPFAAGAGLILLIGTGFVIFAPGSTLLVIGGMWLTFFALLSFWGGSIMGGGGNGFETISAPLLSGFLAATHTAGYLLGVRKREEAARQLKKQPEKKLREIVEDHSDREGTIIYFPTHDWGFMFQRPQQMARHFAKEGFLYFYCTRNERVDAVADFNEVEPNLILTSVPLETFQVVENPILYIGSPWYAPLLDWFSNPTVIYDYYDDLEVSSARVEDHKRLTQEADIVLATSRKLIQSVQKEREDVLYLPNAVDYEWVQTFKPGPGEPPPGDMAVHIEEGRPVIGYIGALAKWFDYGLLAEVARHQDTWQFVLIGADYDQSLEGSDVLEYPNVSWLGWKPYRQLFSYVWHFDVAVIPFIVDEITRATSPVKLYEYFACQKPVVTTPLPECARYNEVLIGQTPDEFIGKIKKALTLTQSGDYLTEIDQIARKNTWQTRVKSILSVLEGKA